MKAGDIYTVAGRRSGSPGDLGDGGPAIRATLSDPQGVAIGRSGQLLIADSGDLRIRSVSP
jgi:hypothetical protein